MKTHEKSTEHRKRRRRREWRTPVTAKLTLDEHAKGNLGTLSTDLFSYLYLHRPDCNAEITTNDVRYIAIAPWRPPSIASIGDCAWTILPVRLQADSSKAASSISFPASAPSLQSFATAVQATQSSIKPKAGYQVLVVEVQPLVLDVVCVKVDADSLRQHEEVQKRFGGGFHTQKPNGHAGKGKENNKAKAPKGVDTERDDGLLGETPGSGLKTALRSCLAELRIIHQGDFIPLPLPAHPVTHVPLPPVKIAFCEPVGQGFVAGQTRIIIDLHASHTGIHETVSRRRGLPLPKMLAEDDEDTSAEQFFSAAEIEDTNVADQQNRVVSASITRCSTSDSSISSDSSGSDDSAENSISLTSLNLLSRSSGVSSALTAGTPRPLALPNDGTSTPGSVFSNYTATTARQRSQASGKTFRLRPLLSKIPDTVLHPSPPNDEDDEARIFVDVKALVRLGCFSGDWVKVSSESKLADMKEEHFLLNAFGGKDVQSESYRVLKVYGLPDTNHHNTRRTPKASSIGNRSRNSVFSRPIPTGYVSPILLANLGSPTTVTVSALSTNLQNGSRFGRKKVTSSSIPPVAKEVTFLRLPTPLSSERAMQSGLFICLKQYFETRRRIPRTGDLIGIRTSIGMSTILSEANSNGESDPDLDHLFVDGSSKPGPNMDTVGIAWFVVGQIHRSSPAEDENTVDSAIWNGAASMEPMTTRMHQVGTHQGKVPPTLDNPWQYYYGIRTGPTLSTCTGIDLSSAEDLPGTRTSSLRRRVRELLAAATSPRATHLNLQPLVILLHSTQRNIGKAYTASAASADLGLHVFPIDAYELLSEGGTGSGDLKTEASLRARLERALTCGAEYIVPIIQHAEALTADRIASALKDLMQELRVLILTTTELDKIPESIRSLFTHEIEVSAPDEGEREDILHDVINGRGVKLAHDVDLAAIAVKTAAFVAGDLVDVVERARVAREERLGNLISDNASSVREADVLLLRDVLVSGGSSVRCVTKTDFDSAVEAARKNFADSIGAPKIPNVSWDDVGGLLSVKDAVMETIQLPLERPELFAKGMKKRSGILFYGPPGTGKTLLAKAIATEFSLNFFSVKGPELLNMYIGESEANVRRVFQRARDARPCVVFFDELDSVAPKRGNQGDSGGVMDRIVSQLLAELDGMSDGDGGGGGVFVIGATNRPDLLDQALLRPGRFDKLLYLGISDSHDKQLTILEALTRKFTLDPAVSLRRIAEVLPFTYTGADLYALCSDAMLKAITRQASVVNTKIKALPGGPVTTAYFFDHYATQEDLAVVVTEEDFIAAQRELTGSVSPKELEHYQRVRRAFEAPERSDNNRNQLPSNSISQDLSIQNAPHQQSSRPKYKSRTTSSANGNGKGKGKAPQWVSDDDDDEAYVTSNDFGSPARFRSTNGDSKGKGVIRDRPVQDGFEDPARDDDENLYR
ncbi:peroxisomal assembly protein [Lambiella insularis]|nr:peroxisomal assembly protein [Lambiella insularis]